MNTNPVKPASNENQTNAVNGWMMLIFNLALLIGAIAWFVWLVTRAEKSHEDTRHSPAGTDSDRGPGDLSSQRPFHPAAK